MRKIIWLIIVGALVVSSCGAELRYPESGMIAADANVATATPTASATIEATVAFTATPDCAVLVSSWNQKFAPTFAALINTDDSLPNEELVVFTKARDSLLSFNAPSCDVDSVFVHTRTLNSLHRYIDWIDAVLASDSAEAKRQESEGDLLFGPAVQAYVGFLIKEGDEDSIKLLFGKSIAELLANGPDEPKTADDTEAPEVSATATITLPTTAHTKVPPTAIPTNRPPTAVPTKRPATAVPTKRPPTTIPTKAVDSCKPQLARFVSSVSKMVSVSRSLLNNMSQYADSGSKSSFSSSFVERTFSGLNGISVPTCADQPTEIVYSLGLIRDTMFPAYIEMEMGGATSASRSDVGRWRDEVNGLLKDVERLMGQID